MFQIDVMSRTPVYEQLVDQVEKFILKGVLSENDQIPSVRSLSVQLSVNPNTIQKAVSELDRRGIIYSVPGRGCFIKPGARNALRDRMREKLPELTDEIRQFAAGGITREEILNCVEEAFEEGGSL